MTVIDLETTAMAVGGEAVARDGDGRVVFVAGALPGERVRVEITDARARFARGHVVDVVDPSTDRVVPPCPNVAAGCGGCDWQHVAVPAQTRLRTEIVAGVLQRDGRIADPVVAAGLAIPAAGVRTTVRGTVDDEGRFAFRRRRSNDPIGIDRCTIAHPLVEEIITEGRFGASKEVFIRVGARTGDRMVVVSPRRGAGVRVPPGVTVVGTDQLKAGKRAWISEEMCGLTWRVSAQSFLQASPEGAEALVAEVQSFVDAWAPDHEHLIDLCAGIGLFAGTVRSTSTDRTVVAVERNASAVADARRNLAGDHVRIIKVAMASWRPSPADVVVADPARTGLGREGVDAVARTGAALCVLVSCDPGALGRDARLLTEAGYRHVGSRTLDLFGHTGQVEVVSGFVRGDV
ncbi:MAG: class I SAM-dependent RNA methyltransferase [Acidimicrobiales bacterium]|nr:class I SAM-dependent RNA methyltransferase [Acidimicrobiales bacterium]